MVPWDSCLYPPSLGVLQHLGASKQQTIKGHRSLGQEHETLFQPCISWTSIVRFMCFHKSVFLSMMISLIRLAIFCSANIEKLLSSHLFHNGVTSCHCYLNKLAQLAHTMTFTNCMCLCQLFNYSVLKFPHLLKWDANSISTLQCSCVYQLTIYVKCLKQHLTHNKCCINTPSIYLLFLCCLVQKSF